MRASTSSSTPAFEKILRAFDTGGFAYTDVLIQLKRLLAMGAPPMELLEILQRHQRIEPLPEYAHSEVLALLNEAVEKISTPEDGSADAQHGEPEMATDPLPNSVSAAARRTAMSPMEREGQDIGAALAEPAVRMGTASAARAAGPAGDLPLLASNVRSLEERIARQHAEHVALSRANERAKEAEMAAAARAAALAADLAAARTALESERNRVREIDKALSESHASAKAASSRGEEALRESERLQTESRMLRDTLAAREAAIAQVLRSLGERDAQLSAVQGERAKIAAALEARSKAVAQMQTELQAVRARSEALTAELASVRSTLQSEQARVLDIDKALAEKSALIETVRSRHEEALRESKRFKTELDALRNSLTDRDSRIAQMAKTLGEREAQLAALQQERGQMLSAREAGAKAHAQKEADLKAAHARAETVSQELKASQEAAALLAARAERAESELSAARAELGAVQSKASGYLEELQSREWRRGFDQNQLRERDAGAESEAAERGALQSERDQWQTTAASLQKKLEAQNALLDELRAAARRRAAELQDTTQRLEVGARAGDTRRESELQAAARREPDEPGRAAELLQLRVRAATQRALPPSEPAAATAAVKSAPPTDNSPSGTELSAPRRAGTRRFRALGLGAAVCVLAAAGWFFAHRSPAPVPAAAPVARPSVAAPAAGTVIRDCPDCPGMTVLPAGRFDQGSSPGEGGSTFEAPQHAVTIGRPFAMSTNAVTVDEFQQFAAATQRDMQGCDIYDGEWKHRPKNSWQDPGFVQTGTHPVTCTSWTDADAYARWLSAKTGHHYRLPSASEWEYAARSGGEAAQPWGSNGAAACLNANVADESAGRRYPGWRLFACNDGYVYTSPVGSFKTNAFGLHDMLGNLFQWTEDCWHADYSAAPADGAARLDGDCSQHELRGGSWFSTPAYVRASYRNHFAADYRTSSVGIRLVRELEP